MNGKWVVVVVVVAISCLVWSTVAQEDTFLVDTTSGTIQCKISSLGLGEGSEVARNCLGVPFAAPPVGDLRFAPPAAVKSWTDVRNATTYSPACMQQPNGLAWTAQGPQELSEDCLYLNVFAPLESVAPPPGGWPVLVFLYGGCYEYGSSALPLYHGNQMLGFQDSAILVSVNYRLGSFGFLGSEELQAESSDGSTGNYGVQDQRAALEWVRDNIHAFGGNKAKVMLFGQSAGSGSTAFHVVSHRSAGLFHRAVFESGPYARWTSLNMSMAQRHYDAVVQSLGCESSDASQEVACIRSKSSQEILDNYQNGALSPYEACSWAPTIDGVELVGPLQYLAQSGQFNRVPVMLGTTADEGTTFVIDCNDDDAAYQQWLNETAGPDLAAMIYARYPSSAYDSPFWAATAVMTDSCMACPARRTARWLSNPPKGSGPGVDAFLYHFDHQPDITRVDKCLGVFHGAELPFVFYDKQILTIGRERDLGKTMNQWWTNFAANGDPNFDGSPIVWPKYDFFSDENAEINVHSTVTANLKQDNCDWWDMLYTANVYMC
eukprot:CAMPEP_0119119876 /NCGR_PEP_ID=MMETSP1310-20130426/1173_1 /TAXON_ID=464262 /ORGANISM="Genus nov. species nov., Strain RCC2339" /LENGTH=547 /DNA_ID=CAMNT_0007109333 /DNA_START=107 /DNA_END=1750 /DNA_ORIENTATION=+